MDKLRENSFGIAVAVCTIAVLALAWFMVIDPFMGDMGATPMRSALSQLKTFANEQRTPLFPTEELVEKRQARQQDLEETFERAKAFYEQKKSRFDELFGEFGATVPQAADFSAKYSTEVKALEDEYKEKYPQARPKPESEDEQELAGLQVLHTPNFFDEPSVRRGMKRFWVINHIFQCVNTLDLGGLKEIDAQRQLDKDEETPEHYDLLPTSIVIHLPMAQVEPLVRELLGSDRVPLLLHNLTVERLPETLIQPLVHEIVYATNDPQQEKLDRESHPGPEPLMRATIDLRALVWKGIPEDEAPDSGEAS